MLCSFALVLGKIQARTSPASILGVPRFSHFHLLFSLLSSQPSSVCTILCLLSPLPSSHFYSLALTLNWTEAWLTIMKDIPWQCHSPITCVGAWKLQSFKFLASNLLLSQTQTVFVPLPFSSHILANLLCGCCTWCLAMHTFCGRKYVRANVNVPLFLLSTVACHHLQQTLHFLVSLIPPHLAPLLGQGQLSDTASEGQTLSQ